MAKIKISDLRGAFYQKVNQLYQAEMQLPELVNDCSADIHSRNLKAEMEKYHQGSADKILKYERIFNYLMQEPAGKSNRVVEAMFEETHELLAVCAGDAVRDAVLISCLRSLLHYKITGLLVARTFALELELDTVVSLLDELLEWERQADREFNRIAVNEVNVDAM